MSSSDSLRNLDKDDNSDVTIGVATSSRSRQRNTGTHQLAPATSGARRIDRNEPGAPREPKHQQKIDPGSDRGGERKPGSGPAVPSAGP